MARAVYVPVESGGQTVSKAVTNIYVGVNGVARKVVKGYVGVNGVARLFWDGGGSVVENFWFYYKTKVYDILIKSKRTQYSQEVTWNKYANSITFFALLHAYVGSIPLDDDYLLVISTDPADIIGTAYISETGTLTYNGDTWYWGFWDSKPRHNAYSLEPIGCRLPDYPNLNTMKTQGISDLLDRIYANDFADDYQVGKTYVTFTLGNIEKTFRKAIAIWLYKNVSLKSNTSYVTLLTNLDTLITHLLGEITNEDKVAIYIYCQSNQIKMDVCYSYYDFDHKKIEDSRKAEGYQAYGSGNYNFVGETKRITVNIDSSISYGTKNAEQIRSIGVAISTSASFTGKSVYLSNIGLFFDLGIKSTLYPNANVFNACTISENNGSRSPVTKNTKGSAVAFIVRNAETGPWGTNWLATVCVALSADAARLYAPETSPGVSSYNINGVTYYVGYQSTNQDWGGGTTISSPIGVPIFDDWTMRETNEPISQATVEEIIQTLGIQVS